MAIDWSQERRSTGSERRVASDGNFIRRLPNAHEWRAPGGGLQQSRIAASRYAVSICSGGRRNPAMTPPQHSLKIPFGIPFRNSGTGATRPQNPSPDRIGMNSSAPTYSPAHAITPYPAVPNGQVASRWGTTLAHGHAPVVPRSAGRHAYCRHAVPIGRGDQLPNYDACSGPDGRLRSTPWPCGYRSTPIALSRAALARDPGHHVPSPATSPTAIVCPYSGHCRRSWKVRLLIAHHSKQRRRLLRLLLVNRLLPDRIPRGMALYYACRVCYPTARRMAIRSRVSIRIPSQARR